MGLKPLLLIAVIVGKEWGGGVIEGGCEDLIKNFRIVSQMNDIDELIHLIHLYAVRITRVVSSS